MESVSNIAVDVWYQSYTPLGSIWLSALVALIPVLFFFLALAVFRMKGHTAGLVTLLLSMLVAATVYGMPVSKVVAAAGNGFVFGLWPIAWIIIAAVFLYKLTVKSGQFDIIRDSIVSITDDQRLQVLLIGFAFGAFLEGAAGFGAPVAITAALLVGLGFNPIYAAGLCLIANTAPVAFGALGVPITVAAQVTGLNAFEIGAMTGRQLPFLSFFVPLWLVVIMDGWKGVKETWPAAFVAGGSFAITQYLTSNFIGPELPDITSSLATIICLSLFLKVWKPKNVLRGQSNSSASVQTYRFGQVFKAWSPFLILTAMVTIWTLPSFKAAFSVITWNFPVIGLHDQVIKTPPVFAKESAMPAIYSFNIVTATGTAILISALLSMLLLGIRLSTAVKAFGETLYELRFPVFSIGLVLAFAYVMNYSGMASTLALALAATGVLFPFFSPFLGWLGVFLTGSDTTSNALFGSLQSTTAQQLDLNQTLMVAANTSGGVTGKMISPQSIAVACAAAGMVGRESDLFRFTLKHSLFFATIVGILTMLQAYVFTWMLF